MLRQADGQVRKRWKFPPATLAHQDLGPCQTAPFVYAASQRQG